jgi:hypothetical protein
VIIRYEPRPARSNRGDRPRTPSARQFLTDDQDTVWRASASVATWMARACIGLSAAVKTLVTVVTSHPRRYAGMVGAGAVVGEPVADPRSRASMARRRRSRPSGSSRPLTISSIHESLVRVFAGA